MTSHVSSVKSPIATDVLFERVRIGPKTLRNRFYQVPFASGFGASRPAAEAAFRGLRAEGGWAAVCTGFCSIDPRSDGFPYAPQLWDESDVRDLSLVSDAIHAHGALAGVQLWHGGTYSTGIQSRLAPLGPSQLVSDRDRVTSSQAMLVSDIKEVQRVFARAVRLARRAGFDIVYVYGSHSHLPMQFLSPFYNRRTDAYGGSFENRSRFWLECLERVREAADGECAIASRISIEPLGPAGVERHEALALIEAADHLVDLWDVNIGTGAGIAWDITPSRAAHDAAPEGWLRDVRKRTQKPVVGVGRFSEPEIMLKAVNAGWVDIIGAARPAIADPFLPQKIERGRSDEIRACVGCNMCTERMFRHQIVCTQNATVGEEYRRGWHPEHVPPAPRHLRDAEILIVGAGAAGLECALVLAQRGARNVHLVDRAAAPGGYAAMLARLPGLRDWSRVVSDRLGQLRTMRGVSLDLGDEWDERRIIDSTAEVVLLATGARWSHTGVSYLSHEPIVQQPGAHVITPEELLIEGVPVSDTVLVYDCEGYVMGSGLAELLASAGKRVTLVTPLDTLAPQCHGTLESGFIARRLADLKVAVITQTQVADISTEACTVAHSYDGEREIPADTVVLVTSRVSDDRLFRRLATEAPNEMAEREVHRLGDSVVPRHTSESVFDGRRLALELARSPSDASAFLREHSTSGRHLYGGATA